MPCTIWCDRVKHEVQESRGRIMDKIEEAYQRPSAKALFIYVTPAEPEERTKQREHPPNQKLLNVAFISSIDPGENGVR